MATNLTNTTFLTTYKDDFRDSDNYHRVLFNSGRTVQARELTQMQTIIQKEIERFGSNIFVDGSVIRPGGVTVNNRFEYIKLATGQLPQNPQTLVGKVFTVKAPDPALQVKILKVIEAENSDPDTLYVEYMNTQLGTSSTDPIRVGNSQTLENTVLGPTYDMETASSGAAGVGTEASIAEGVFFVQGHFVYAEKQSYFVSKYTSNPSEDIGFRIVEQVVTELDNDALYDNQGAAPNLAAPGAHRYRIRLLLANRSSLTASDNFVYLARISGGKIVDEVTKEDAYNTIVDLLARRTREESGNYIVKPFTAKYAPLNDSNLQLEVSDGVAYVDGYRLDVNPKNIIVPKAQDTITINNETVVVQYGNYVLGSGNNGLPNIDTFAKIDLRSSTGWGGTKLGTARVRAVEEDGANYRFYLFDIQMAPGANFSTVQSMGTSSTDYVNLVLESGSAVLKSTLNNDLLFPLPRRRPTQTGITPDTITVQRRYTFTTNGSGNVTGAPSGGPGAGYTFTNASQWIISRVGGAIDTSGSITLNGTQTAFDITGLDPSTNYEVLAYVNKSSPTSRTKNLTETTITKAWPADAESDGTGNGVQFISLDKADIYRVKSIKITDSDGADISTNFIIDNGQRDNYYGIGRLIKRGGVTIPTGNIFSRFEYFTHTTGDFFDITSYQAAQVPYESIPNHRLNNGERVELRDVMDFRPVATRDFNEGIDSGVMRFNFDSDGAGNDPIINYLPQNTGTFTADIVYYMPRRDILVTTPLSPAGERLPRGDIRYVQGVSSLNPQLPEIPIGSMPLYNFRLNPYTLNESDLSSTFIPAKRFTMADIAELENRIDTLQETTALSLLELNTSSLEVLDSAGLPRTKAGFLVDNFRNAAFSAINRTEYRAAHDELLGLLGPLQSAKNLRMILDSDASTTQRHGDLVTLPITNHVALIDQNLATETENINPFAVIVSNGHVDLSPASDEWVETQYAPDNIVDDNRDDSELETVRLATLWIPLIRQTLANFRDRWIGQPVGGRVLVRGDVRTRREIIGDRIIDVSFIPFMRSRKIFFRAQGLRRYTKHFLFFGGRNISDYARTETAFERFASRDDNPGNIYTNTTQHPDGPSDLISDSAGGLIGSFIIPSTKDLKFRTGTQRFQLMDVTSGDADAAISKAQTTFTATGILNTRQRTVRTTRIQTEFFVQEYDPLAQSFRIDGADNPNGVFITKVDAYFNTRDDIGNGVPVQCQIRPVENGIPTSAPVPGAVKFLQPREVNIPANLNDITSIRATPTTFEFDEPIFLQPQQDYAIVLLADTTAYSVYVARTYEFLLGSTEQRVTKQPTLGSMFLSQNGITWTPDQNRDLMFKLYRAEFGTSATSILENSEPPLELLGQNPILTDSGSSTLRVFHYGHGFTKNDYVTLSGLDSSTSYGGILGSSIMGTRQVVNVDHTGYTFNADSNATASIRVGGNGIIATQNAMFDAYVPQLQSIIAENTSLSAQIKLTDGSSYANGRNTSTAPRTKDTTYTTITLNDINYTESPKAFYSGTNEAIAPLSGAKSGTMQLTLSTNDTKVSPIVDLQRCSITAFENVIDKQDASLTSGYNVPISFVDETHPTDGTSAAKHVTVPVTLEEPAVGLKILFGANRPSTANFRVYYKIGTSDTDLDTVNYVEIAESTNNPADEDRVTYRQYEYLPGGQVGNLPSFTKFQVKIVMETTNSSKPPSIKDLRILALVT
jgi:hypothetical protein